MRQRAARSRSSRRTARFAEVSAQQESDLFWALRGGGGNFGVVTNFEYQLHPLEHPVFAGGKLYPYKDARAVLTALFELGAEDARRDDSLTVGHRRGRPQRPVPPGQVRRDRSALQLAIRRMATKADRAVGRSSASRWSTRWHPSPTCWRSSGPTGAAPPALPAGAGLLRQIRIPEFACRTRW